jgi:hypothetical protein
MGKGLHRCAAIIGMVMAQVSMKTALKKWDKAAEQAINMEMKQLHRLNLYNPMHWHEWTTAQKEHILECHMFVEENQDGKIKARKMVGGNKQQDYITKEVVSPPMVSAEAVMLTCVINALEDWEIAVIDIPNAFVQTVVKDEEHCVIVPISGQLVDILVSIAPDVYGPYVSTNKAGQKVLLVQCLSAVYGKMVAALLYYKKFVRSLTKQGYKINTYDGCVVNEAIKGKQVTIYFHIDDCKISHKSSAVIDDTIAWRRVKYESTSETVLCPILWGINLPHIYAREVRWNFEFDSWYSSKICSYQSKKKWHSLHVLFLIISTLKGDVQVKISHFTIFLFRPYVKKGEYRIEFVCGNVII